MFKKATAIILSLALLVVGAFVTPIASAEGPTQLVQDFESYEATGNTLVAYQLTDGNAHSGTKSIYRAADSATYGVSVFPTATTQALIAEKEYELRFWIKIASAVPGTSTIQLMYSQAKDNAYTTAKVAGSSTPNISVLKTSGSTNVDTSKVGEWQEIVYQFTATHTGYLAITGWGTSEYYLDDITLKEIKPTTISFNTNGGSTVNAVSGNAGSQITMPEPPTKAGFVFEGWYTNAELTESFTATVFPESDITLYAKWRAEGVLEQDFESYEASGNKLVAYTLYTSNGTDGNAHSGIKSIYRAATNATYGVAVFPTATAQALIAEKEYELRFWIKIASAVPGTSTIQLMYSSDKSNANAQVSGSSKPNISVLKTSGSTNIDTSKVGEWQEIVYKFTATHTGHLAITGWGTSEYYLDDITLSEVKETKKSTITFNTNGGSEIDAMTDEVGATITMPANPTKANHTFEGWYTNEELTESFTATVFPESDITLYAKWISYTTITFNTNGGSEIDAMTDEVGATITMPEAPTKADHTFEGWYTNEELTESFTATVFPESDITLYAKWAEIKYIETAHNQKAAMLTAEASANGKQGIRIYNKIDKAFIAEKDVVEFGSIVIREGFLKSVYKYVNGSEMALNSHADVEREFTLDLRNAYAAKDNAKYATAHGYGLGVSCKDGDLENAKLWSSDDDSYEFTAFIVGIEPKYYDDIYYIRSYAVKADGTVVYGDAQPLCIYDQVTAILNATDASQTDIDAANAVIAKATAAAETDDSVVTYEAWKNAQ